MEEIRDDGVIRELDQTMSFHGYHYQRRVFIHQSSAVLSGAFVGRRSLLVGRIDFED